MGVGNAEGSVERVCRRRSLASIRCIQERGVSAPSSLSGELGIPCSQTGELADWRVAAVLDLHPCRDIVLG